MGCTIAGSSEQWHVNRPGWSGRYPRRDAAPTTWLRMASLPGLKVVVFHGVDWGSVSIRGFMDEMERCVHWRNKNRIKRFLGGRLDSIQRGPRGRIKGAGAENVSAPKCQLT